MMERTLEIWTEKLPTSWAWTPCDYLGGTPEFVVNTAICAKDRFDEVIVYYDGPSGEYDGVYYMPRSMYEGRDIVLSCNSSPPLMGKYNIYWTNWDHQRDKNVMSFDERIVLSPYQKSVFGSNSRIVPHSLWPSQFKNPVKVRKQCLYSSSPDRGGEFLDSIWDEVYQETGATLIKTYSSNISEDEMVELYKSSEYWLHPCRGVEMFCIAAVKAQVARCIPVVVPNMALETTVKFGVKTTLDKYRDDLIHALNYPPAVEDVDFGTWETVTEKLFENVKCSSPVVTA